MEGHKSINLYNVFVDIAHCFIVACGISFITLFYYYDMFPTMQDMKELFRSLFLFFISLRITYEIANKGRNWLHQIDTVSVSPCRRLKEELLETPSASAETVKHNMMISAIHEAGHAVMHYILDMESFNVILSYTSPKVVTVFKQANSQDVKKHILIKYSGAAAEELPLGQFTCGCMGVDEADFECAAQYLKAYILMTDKSVSKSLLDEELSDKVISLSNELYFLALRILSDNKEMIELLSKELLRESAMTKEQIEKLFADNHMTPKHDATYYLGNSIEKAKELQL